MNTKIARFLFSLIILAILSVCLIGLVKPNLPGFENAVLLARKHSLPETTLSPQLENAYGGLLFLESSIKFIDSHFRGFPSSIVAGYWSDSIIYFLQILPILIILSVVASVNKKAYVLLALVLFISLFPFGLYYQKIENYVVIKTGFRLITPISKSFEVIWSPEVDKEAVKYFSYTWKQNHPTKKSIIKISCLGHYQINVNDRYFYNGPVFSLYPKVFYDELDISNYISTGNNEIKISCQYLKGKIHEHQDFPHPGLIVGGSIKDGLFSYNLADYRFWRVTGPSIVFLDRLSLDTGYAEKIDLTKFVLPAPAVRLENNLVLEKRPISLLDQTLIPLTDPINDTYDLGTIKVGYFDIVSDIKDGCEIKISYLEDHDNQDDSVVLPSGKSHFRQSSRRSGRYVKVDRSRCLGEISFSFIAPSYPIDHFEAGKNREPFDKAIFAIADQSVTNGLQDQIEDSLTRERALYIGDAYSVFKCLPPSQVKNQYFRYTLRSLAAGQDKDGALPAMAHSQNNFIIPDYTLTYPIFLEEYIKESQDIRLLKENLPTLDKIFGWIKSNLTTDSLMVDRYGKNWWTFIDWTKRDSKYEYDTGLQLYLVRALSSLSAQFLLLGKDASEINTLRVTSYQNLLNLGYFPDRHLFSDSFSSSGSKTSPGIVTNALAGKFGIFPSLEDSGSALKYFGNTRTSSPFSETWVAEWAISLGQKEKALNMIRDYWGALVRKGATSVYENFDPNSGVSNGTHSHIWGCGPVFLYNQGLLQ